MTKDIYKVPDKVKLNSLMSKEEYENLYDQSIKNPEKFWSEQAIRYLDWDSKWTNVKQEDFLKGEVRWFENAKINASKNCIDRHLKNNGNKTAIIWEGDDPQLSRAGTGPGGQARSRNYRDSTHHEGGDQETGGN